MGQLTPRRARWPSLRFLGTSTPDILGLGANKSPIGSVSVRPPGEVVGREPSPYTLNRSGAVRGRPFAGLNEPAGFGLCNVATFPAPNDAPCRSQCMERMGAPLGGANESREFTRCERRFVAPNTGKLGLKLQLDPRPRAARRHADDLGVIARPSLGG